MDDESFGDNMGRINMATLVEMLSFSPFRIESVRDHGEMHETSYAKVTISTSRYDNIMCSLHEDLANGKPGSWRLSCIFTHNPLPKKTVDARGNIPEDKFKLEMKDMNGDSYLSSGDYLIIEGFEFYLKGISADQFRLELVNANIVPYAFANSPLNGMVFEKMIDQSEKSIWRYIRGGNPKSAKSAIHLMGYLEQNYQDALEVLTKKVDEKIKLSPPSPNDYEIKNYR